MRTRSGSARTIHPVASSDLDARHKVASLTAQLIQRDHRIRGLEQGVQTKLAEVRRQVAGNGGQTREAYTSAASVKTSRCPLSGARTRSRARLGCRGLMLVSRDLARALRRVSWLHQRSVT